MQATGVMNMVSNAAAAAAAMCADRWHRHMQMYLSGFLYRMLLLMRLLRVHNAGTMSCNLNLSGTAFVMLSFPVGIRSGSWI